LILFQVTRVSELTLNFQVTLPYRKYTDIKRHDGELIMKSDKSTSRIIGIVLLAQLAAALMLPFIILRPRIIGFPDFITAAAENSFQVRSAVFIAVIGSALTITLGVLMLPVLRRSSETLAFWFLSACLVSCVIDLVHCASVMSMLSLSQGYVSAGATNQAAYETIGATVASTRRWAHVAQLLAIGGWIFIFYGSLLRFNLIPRALASLGVIGIALQFTGVTLMMFLGLSVIGQLAMPLLPIHLTTAGWLIVKGFRSTEDAAISQTLLTAKA